MNEGAGMNTTFLLIGDGVNSLVLLLGGLGLVALVARMFFGKRLLWLPVRIVRGLVFLVVSSIYDRHDPRRWR